MALRPRASLRESARAARARLLRRRGEHTQMLNGMAQRFVDWRGAPFAIRFLDGPTWHSSAAPPAFTIEVRSPVVLARLAAGQDLDALGEAFVAGDLDVKGDLLEAVGLATHLRARLHRPLESLRFASRIVRATRSGIARASTKLRADAMLVAAREAVNFHYELPYAFFRLFLDERDVYSCAYFRDEADSLEQAQLQKLDLVCKKLRLRAGEDLLDLGSGWGSLSTYAARTRGARVFAIGLSERMADVGRERAAKEGVADRCRFEVRDVRDLGGVARFDKIASVGAIEHVPLAQQRAYFRRCFDLLRPGGLLLNHGITMLPHRPLGGGNRFLQKHVFPRHEIVPLHATLAEAQRAGFSVCDVESLREHYAKTLALWHQRLDARADDARRIAGERVYRAFRVYLAGMSHHFAAGGLDIHQSLLSKSDGGRSGLPLTREDLYEP
jgi:cyclopropane-fatty-acyl-phospholipid synthase